MRAPGKFDRAKHRAGRFITRRWKLLSSAAAFGLVALAAYMTYSSFDPRVTDAYAEQRLESTDAKLQKLEMDAMDSPELGTTTIDYNKRTVTPEYLVQLNGLAVKLLLIRSTIMNNADQSFRGDIFYDIEGLVKALNGCGSMPCGDVKKAVEDYKHAYADVQKATTAIGKVLTGTNDLVRIHKGDRLTDIENLDMLLLSTMEDPHMLVHNNGKPRFDDIDEYQQAMWELYHVHQNLLASYYEKEKLNKIVKELAHQQ